MTDAFQIIGIFAAIGISIVSLFITFRQTKIAQEANDLAKTANDLAEKAKKDANKPSPKIRSLFLDPQNAYVFGGGNVKWTGKKKLREDQLKVIHSTFRSDSIVKFMIEPDGHPEEYLLVNICDKESRDEDIGLILNAITFTAENDGPPIIEMTINEAYSMTSQNESFPTDMKVRNSTIIWDKSSINIKFAYACRFNQASSLNLESIAQIIEKEKDIIDLIECRYRAGEILGFAETAYQFTCRTADNQSYDFSLVIDRDMDNDGSLKTHRIYYTRKEFDIRAKEASERARQNVVVKKVNG